MAFLKLISRFDLGEGALSKGELRSVNPPGEFRDEVKIRRKAD